MMKRLVIGVLMAMLLVQSVFTGKADAAKAFTDISKHWAQQPISELASLGIVKGNGKFYPDRLISRGEAIAMLNRVFEYVYGPVAKPVRKTNIDYRYPLRWEIEQLLTNMNAMLQIETGSASGYDPGDRMLYYLYLSDRGQLIKQPEKQNPDWWLSAYSLQKPMSREEASVVLFNLLTPQIYRTANIKPQDANAYFTSYYQWKQESYYRDTYSPYATAIREFNLFASPTKFQPYKKMTRAEYVVVLKRLLDYYQKQVTLQFQEKGVAQQKIATAFLRAAHVAYERKSQAQPLKYFTPTAFTGMGKLGRVPLHTELAGLTVKVDETDMKKLWLIARYQKGVNGSYQIEYRLDPDPTSTYGRKIAAVMVSQK